ncbi:phosphoenolpyruvate carboxylase, partial [Lysobacter sp. 2RAB21]
DLAELRTTMGREHWDRETVYRQYAQVGIEYGPAHRGITGLDSGEDRVLADLALPDALAGEDNAAYVLHPALIDSALQAAIGLGAREAMPSDPMLPFALESLCILGDCGARLHAFIRRADASSQDPAQITLDLDLCDADGNICVQMRGFCARRFDAGSAASREAADVETLVAVPAWSQPHPRGAATSAADFAHHRVLLCDLHAADPVALASIRPGSVVEPLMASQVGHPALRYEAIALQVFERLQDALKQHSGEKTLIQCVIADNAEGRLLAGLGGMLRTATLENPSLTTQLVIVEAEAPHQRLAADLAEGDLHARFHPGIAEEFERTRHAVLTIKGSDELLAGDHRLRQSIRLRNPYVDPISLLQVDLLARWRAAGRQEDALLQALVATVNGIAAGVQNTG